MSGRAEAEFTPATKRKLAQRVGWKCSGCRAPTSGPTKGLEDGTVNLGEAAHICGAAPGSARYDPLMTNEQRRHIDNGIWLCRGCAKKVDDDEHYYTVSRLQEWRKEAEDEAHRQVGRPSVSPGASEGSAAATQHPRRFEYPVLPFRTTLRRGPQNGMVRPRELSLWIEPDPPLDLGAGEARMVLAAVMGAEDEIGRPLVYGDDESGRGESHPTLGTWVALWNLEASNPHLPNMQELVSLGLSDRGVLAWQHERAHESERDTLHLTETVQRVASFLRRAVAVYAELDPPTDTRLSAHLAVGVPRPSELIVEGTPFFGRMVPRQAEVEVVEVRNRGRVRFELDRAQVPRLTHKLVNQFLASCRSVPTSFAADAPAIVSIELDDVRQWVSSEEESEATSEVELTLDYRVLSQTRQIHHYELVATLRNVSKRRIDDWELEVEFPTPLIDPGQANGCRVRDRSDATMSLYRLGSHMLDRPLRAGDRRELTLAYHVNDEIYWRRKLLSQSATARASIDGVQVVEIVRLIGGELENF